MRVLGMEENEWPVGRGDAEDATVATDDVGTGAEPAEAPAVNEEPAA